MYSGETDLRMALRPKLKAFFSVWYAAYAKSADVPCKSDIDPVDLASWGLLPDIWLVERVSGRDFRCRLAGERINENYGRQINGMLVSELLDPNAASRTIEHYNQIIENQVIHYSFGEVHRIETHPYYGCRLLVPLKSASGAVDLIMGVADRLDYGYSIYVNKPQRPDYKFEGIVTKPAEEFHSSALYRAEKPVLACA